MKLILKHLEVLNNFVEYLMILDDVIIVLVLGLQL